MPSAAEALQILGGGGDTPTPAFAPESSVEASSGIQHKLDILSGKTEAPIETPSQPKVAGEDRGAADAFMHRSVGMMSFGLDKPFNAAMMAGVTDPIAHAFTGNDEKYGGSFGDRYDRRLHEQQADEELASQNHPIASTAGDVAGLIGSLGAAPVKAGAEAVIPTLWQATKQNAKIGAAVGGLNSLGYADGDMGDRLEAGVKGAATGGAMGAIIPPALMTKTGRAITLPLAGATAGYALGEDKSSAATGLALGVAALKAPGMIGTLYQHLTQSTDDRLQGAALQKMRQVFGRDNMTADEAKTLLESMGEHGTIADVGGENVLGLARATAGVPGEAKDAITKTLNARQQGQSQRVEQAVEKNTGATANYHDAEAALIEQQDAASPLYKEALTANQSIKSPAINRILRTPAGKSALEAARVKMQNDMTLMGVPDKELAEQAALAGVPQKGGIAAGLKLRTLDYVKRSLDDMIGAAIRSGEKDQARILQGMKRTLVNELDAADVTAVKNAKGEVTTPGKYKQARDAYSGPAQSMEALENGRAFMADDAEVTVRQLADLSAGDKQMFMIGAVRTLKDKIRNTPYGSDAVKNIFGSPNQLFGSPAKRERLMAVFPTKEAFAEFEKSMLAEAKMYATRAHVLPRQGSKTAPTLAEEADAGIIPTGLEQMATGDYKGAIKDFGMKFLERYKMSPEIRNLIGQKLFSQNPAENIETLRMLQQLEQTEQSKLNGGLMQIPGMAGQSARAASMITTQ